MIEVDYNTMMLHEIDITFCNESYTPPRLYTVIMNGSSLHDVSGHGEKYTNERK